MHVKPLSHSVKRTIFRRSMGICSVLSALSVVLCIGYNLTLEHYIGLMNTPTEESPFSATEILEDDVPDDTSEGSEDLMDFEGLPVITDTKSVINLLLIGTDARTPGEPCRSDAMILLSINTKTEKIIACSLLRDILVSIDGYADNRLNTAYSYGGADLLLDTLNQNFNIDIQYYMSVDFAAFAQVVDLLGGVDLFVTAAEISVMNGIIRQMNTMSSFGKKTAILPVQDGTCHLDGMQALAYARDRSSSNGDFDRASRQRTVLTALVQKVKDSSVFELFNLLTAILPNITTNIPEAKLKTMVSSIPVYLKYDIVMTALPKEKSYNFVTVRDMAVIDIDFEENIRYLAEQIYS